MQDRVDGINRVLREQAMGIRVLRAFAREPWEEARFAKSNDDLTDVANAISGDAPGRVSQR